MTDSRLLQALNVTKSYTAVRALDGVSFDLRAGEAHALVGENGAGKSTLVKIITGAIRPDSGELWLNGNQIKQNAPRMAKQLGIAAIYQHPVLFPDLTVAENIAIGLEERGHWRRINWRHRRRRAEELLAQIGASIDPDEDAGNLSMPRQQLVEIARALGANAKILILDEPTASLTDEDTRKLFSVIANLKSHGTGMIYISHRLEELPEIADRVTVLRDGRTVDTLPISRANTAALINLMVGRELSAIFPRTQVERGEVVFEIINLNSTTTGLRNIRLELRAGEIVGLAGLVGAGRTALAQTIFGLAPADSGAVRMQGKTVRITSPSEAIRSGIAYLPEDRLRHSVIPQMPISANITLARLDQLSRFGALHFATERDIAAGQVATLGIKTPSTFAPVSTLSGGNQQKVALGRWLITDPKVLILDEPTQGIDVGAKAQIHGLINDLTSYGMAVLMISSDLPEILGMSDRIAVMAAGTITGILERSEATQEKILSLALGHRVMPEGDTTRAASET